VTHIEALTERNDARNLAGWIWSAMRINVAVSAKGKGPDLMIIVLLVRGSGWSRRCPETCL